MKEILLKTAFIIFNIMGPFIFAGVILRVKSIWAGRQGPSVFQPFNDFIKLLKKGEVISTTGTFITQIAPSISVVSLITASLLLPIGFSSGIIGFRGDFILFIYLFALSKFFMILNAFDSGSSFQGMGASRDAVFTALIEPAFFIIFASISLITGYHSFADILMIYYSGKSWTIIIIVLTASALFIMLIVEGCRVPFDDPATHLELTMIHEVMILDTSGINLAYSQYASNLKMFLIASLISTLVIHPGINVILSGVLYVGIIFFIAVIVGAIESLRPRRRMIHNPDFVMIMLSISMLILASVIIQTTGGIQ